MSSAFPPSIVRPPSPGKFFGDHERRITVLERGSNSMWHYVRPLAPAATPPDYVDPDSIAPSFQSGWSNNVGDEQAVSFRLHPSTHLEIRGGITGGTLPSIVFTLPDGFRPAVACPVTFPSRDGTAVLTGRIDPTGDVWILAEIASSGAYVPPTAWQVWSDSATVLAGADQDVTWADPGTNTPDASGGLPSPVLDLSDVLDPAVLVDGTYSVSLSVNTSDRAAVGDYILVNLFVAQAGADYSPSMTIDVGANVLSGLFVAGTISDSFPIFAGDSIGAVITNKTASDLVIAWKTAISRIT